MSPRAYSSWLGSYFQRFVALKRATGADYRSQETILLAFDQYLAAHVPARSLRRDDLSRYLGSLESLSRRSRDNVTAVVWPALTHARAHGAAIDPLPERVRCGQPFERLRPIRILSKAEIALVLNATRRLSPYRAPLRPATVATLLGLLLASGIRVGEALALDVGDVDFTEHLLTIRQGKFRKARVLPQRPSTMTALARYLEEPYRPMPATSSSPLFVSRLGRRLSMAAIAKDFRRVCQYAGIISPRPCLHSLRHTFAVTRVASWYTDGRDVNAWLPALSTYMGHVSVENTRRYLVANGLLLELAAARYAHATRVLDEVAS